MTAHCAAQYQQVDFFQQHTMDLLELIKRRLLKTPVSLSQGEQSTAAAVPVIGQGIVHMPSPALFFASPVPFCACPGRINGVVPLPA
jgi:hypothetical protein